jgi:hypothetical protein
MVPKLITNLKEQYKANLSTQISSGPHGNYASIIDLNTWKSITTFQENWNIDAFDLKSMYAASFANTLSNELWEGRSFFPKKAMLTFIDRDPDLVRMMFNELFNENLDIEGRIDRFIYHCDEVSHDIMRSNPQYQSHYHGDYRMISVYLAFRYPEVYTIYQFPVYKTFMELIKARPEPSERDIGRFFKVMRTIYSIISKDDELMAAHRAQRSIHSAAYQEDSLMLARDFYWFCGNLQSRESR